MRFTEKQKLEEVLAINPQLILMLPRFDMKLGFGEKRVDEVCRVSNVPISLFLLLCNVYTYDDFEPSEEDIRSINGKCLVKYLIASHDFYLNHRLKHIEKHVEKIANSAGKVGNVLMSFFKKYEDEVAKHFMVEESSLFPHLLKLEEGESSKYKLKDILEMHDNIEDQLSDLTNIIIKYLPADIMPNERIGVWFDIIQLSKDLIKHAVVEEKILIPYVNWLEGGKK
ncbi:MAG: hemerythrin domain-containing protein [Paludibacteraceae bacterium]|nr:hemerythrin domain-containing protein [Paludibacteraceae bacterium]